MVNRRCLALMALVLAALQGSVLALYIEPTISQQALSGQNGTLVAAGKPNWDYLVHVQVWPPAWLGDSGNYPYDGTYWSVHGVWPNFLDGTWPQNCPGQTFDPSQLSPIVSRLRKYWTNFRDDEAFWKHEYDKHLTCMMESSYYRQQRQCFEFGLNAQGNLNLMNWFRRANVVPSNTQKFSVATLTKTLDEHVGAKAILECKDQRLQQVLVCYTEAGKKMDCPPAMLKRRCSDAQIWIRSYKRV